MTTELTDYELGRKAFNTPGMAERVNAHYAGIERLERSEDWFAGFQDAEDDARWNDPKHQQKLMKWERDNVDMF